MSVPHKHQGPAALLSEHLHLLTPENLEGPVLDLACGDGHNGIRVAGKGLPVILADISEDALGRAKELATREGVEVAIWRVDLEKDGEALLDGKSFGAILVFHFLHRPLLPVIRAAVKEGGVLLYEAHTVEQPRFGKPRNPDFLLRPGELREAFGEWEIIHYFEGIKSNPERAIAQIVCRRPSSI